MIKTFEALDSAFDTQPTIIEQEIVVAEPKPLVSIDEQNAQSDKEFARSTIKGLVTKSSEALDDLLELAKGTEHPRAYEVTATFINSIASATKQLVEISKLEAKEQPRQNTNIQNAEQVVFVGSPAELLRMKKEDEQRRISEATSA